MAKQRSPEPTDAELLRAHAAAIRKIPDLGTSDGDAGCLAGRYIERAIELGAFNGGPRDTWLPRLRERLSLPKKPSTPDPHLSAFAEAEGLAKEELGHASTPPNVTDRGSFEMVAAVLDEEADRMANRKPPEPTADTNHDHLVIAPSEVLSLAFRNVANAFTAIRREWIKGDVEQKRLLASGFAPSSSGYADVMTGQVRTEVARLHAVLNGTPDLLPQVLAQCDPSLRDAILRMMRMLSIHAVLPDRYGEESERWRQTWEAIGLDADLDDLLTMIRAAADRLVLDGDPIQLSREWLEDYLFRLEEAARVLHRPGAIRADFLKVLAWADDPKRDIRHKALEEVLEQIRTHPSPPYSAEVLLVEYDALVRIPVDARLRQGFGERMHAWLDRVTAYLSISTTASATSLKSVGEVAEHESRQSVRHGKTQKELREATKRGLHSGISQTVFRRIVKNATIRKTGDGEKGRLFTPAEVRNLIDTANRMELQDRALIEQSWTPFSALPKPAKSTRARRKHA